LRIVRLKRTIVRNMRTTRHQVIDWLFPRVRKNVLSLLLADPERRWHLRDVVRKTACAIGTVRRELKGLVACGLVLETRDGNRTYYQANRACAVFPELVGVVRKTSGLADVLRGALETLEGQIRVAFVYGSLARQEGRAGSDVDLVLIGRAGFREVVSALTSAQETLGREINPTVYSPQEFRKKLSSGHHFVRTVMGSQKIFLIGDADELGRLAR
jgi:predicted nucleotidyltransferase